MIAGTRETSSNVTQTYRERIGEARCAITLAVSDLSAYFPDVISMQQLSTARCKSSLGYDAKKNVRGTYSADALGIGEKRKHDDSSPKPALRD